MKDSPALTQVNIQYNYWGSETLLFFMLGIGDNNPDEGREKDAGQDDQYQGGLYSVAPETTVLSGLGTVLLTNDKYRSGGF